MIKITSIVKLPSFYQDSGHGDLVGVLSAIAQYHEILIPFFKNYNIVNNWIDCNYTFGEYDNKTGKWTGALGQVNLFT